MTSYLTKVSLDKEFCTTLVAFAHTCFQAASTTSGPTDMSHVRPFSSCVTKRAVAPLLLASRSLKYYISEYFLQKGPRWSLSKVAKPAPGTPIFPRKARNKIRTSKVCASFPCLTSCRSPLFIAGPLHASPVLPSPPTLTSAFSSAVQSQFRSIPYHRAFRSAFVEESSGEYNDARLNQSTMSSFAKVGRHKTGLGEEAEGLFSEAKQDSREVLIS